MSKLPTLIPVVLTPCLRLDGLKRGPILLGDIADDWLNVAKPAVEARMSRYAATETSFALLTVRPKRSTLLENELEELQARLESLGDADGPAAEELRMEMLTVRHRLEDEQGTQERQRQENIRRRHNYVPFITALLKHLSNKGKLQEMVEHAKQRAQAQQERKDKK